MNDASQPNLVSWLLALLGTMIMGTIAYVRRKFDKFDERIGGCVTRAEMAALEAKIDARAAEAGHRTDTNHAQNSDNFREVRLQLESVNSKLFELASK